MNSDSSSNVISNEISIKTTNHIPVFNDEKFIDPLIIDFKNDGIQLL